MVETIQLNYPNKTHIVEERTDKSTVKTACGLTFEQPNGLHLLTSDLDKYQLPPKEAQCGNCPWGDTNS